MAAANVVMIIFTIILFLALLASAYMMASMAVGKKYGLGLFSREIENERIEPLTDKDGKQLYDENQLPISRTITVQQTQYHPWVMGGVGITVLVSFLACVITGGITASKETKEGFKALYGF